MAQYAIVTDLNRCTGCLACAVACKAANGVPVGSYWNKVLRIGPNPKYEGAVNPDVELYFLPVGCQHCEEPECVRVCPTGASHKLADGTVQIDKSKCIGCQFCAMACPYNVRYLNEEEGVVEKCTLCEQ
ncbi:MAG TPA: 4Fe-4S dicluster domain-containing protein, partial [Candidatus Rubneribacter avistercoris]|nr:4Fe-4S dicluster domain-containing protein [Candidatus Rubneribacter avistercoris]